MKIGDYDYKFLYSVGAFLAIEGAHLPARPATAAERIRSIYTMAVIMSNAYEEAQALYDPDYEKHTLKPELLKTLTMAEFKQLSAEVDAAVKAGQERTVESEPVKKNGTKAKK